MQPLFFSLIVKESTMKRWIVIILISIFSLPSQAQSTDSTKNIALFIPLYLDSAFQNNQYSFQKDFPKFLNPGLEFWQGAQIAIDSLQQKGFNLTFQVFDIKAKDKKLLDVLLDSPMSNIDLIIGLVNVNEASLLAQFAKLKEVPFINVNLPNSVNQTENPHYFILNATLPTHFKAIYRHLQSRYSIDNIVLFKRKNEQDNFVSELILKEGAVTAAIPLKIKVVELLDNFNLDDLSHHITADKHNVIIGSSLDLNFAKKLASSLHEVQDEYNTSISIFGMPTWDQINFNESIYSGLEIFYTTPFNFDITNEQIAHLTDWYKSKYFARPSDMVFRGYEIIYKFSQLISKNDGNLAFHPQLNTSNIFTQYHILPIYNTNKTKINYWENQKIYFVRLASGEIAEIK